MTTVTNPPRAPPVLYQARHGTRWEKEKASAGVGAFDFADDPKTVGPWVIGECVGKGASGRVKIAQHSVTGQLAAVKILPLEAVLSSRLSLRTKENKSEKHRNGIDKEIVMMKLMDHPNIIRIYDVFQSEKDLYLILEYVEGGELFDYLVNHGKMTATQGLAYFKQIIHGLSYSHAFSIIHRDLKPENILIKSLNPPHVKIADWGMAAFAPPAFQLETSCGSPHYASPEIVNGKRYEGTSTDIWSCGVILFALMTGRLPFDDKNIKILLSKVKSGKYEIPSYVDAEAADLIRRMLVVDVDARISMSEILAHPFLRHPTPGVDCVTAPSISELDRPLRSASSIKPELLRCLEVIWGRTTPEEITKELLSPPGQGSLIKALYFLLAKHRERTLENFGMHGIFEDERAIIRHYPAPPPKSPTPGVPSSGIENTLSVHSRRPPPASPSRSPTPTPTHSALSVNKTHQEKPSPSRPFRSSQLAPIGPRQPARQSSPHRPRPMSTPTGADIYNSPTARTPVPSPNPSNPAYMFNRPRTQTISGLPNSREDPRYQVAHAAAPWSGRTPTMHMPMYASPVQVTSPPTSPPVLGSPPRWTNPITIVPPTVNNPATQRKLAAWADWTNSQTRQYNELQGINMNVDHPANVQSPADPSLASQNQAPVPWMLEQTYGQRQPDAGNTTPRQGQGDVFDDDRTPGEWTHVDKENRRTRDFGLGLLSRRVSAKRADTMPMPNETAAVKQAMNHQVGPFAPKSPHPMSPVSLLRSPFFSLGAGEWLSSIMHWGAQTYYLYSVDNCLATRDELIRLLERYRVHVVLDDPQGWGILRCRVNEEKDEYTGSTLRRPIRFRIEVRPVLGYNQPVASNGSENKVLPPPYASTVIFHQERGALSTFTMVYEWVKTEWALGALRSPEVGGVTPMVAGPSRFSG